MSCCHAFLQALLHCQYHSFYHAIVLCTSGLMWCDQCSIVCKCFELLWWKLWSPVWHHCLVHCTHWRLVSSHQLWHYFWCSSFSWWLETGCSSQQLGGKFKLEEDSSYLFPRPLWNLMWHQNVSVGSWRSHTPWSSVLSVGCLLLPLARILILCPPPASSQHQNGLHEWSKEICYKALWGWWVCVPSRVGHFLHLSL